jgi:hypothetical protein
MRNDFCLLLGFARIIALSGMIFPGSLQGVCYTTPHSAVGALETGSSFPADINRDGYQVTRIESDPVLGKKWAILARCGDPSWPLTAVPTNGASSFTAIQKIEDIKVPLIVRAGDIVRLWSQEVALRFEVSGMAEESGGLGQTIRVRLAHKNTDDQSPPPQFMGVIRGHSEVEILR